METDFGGKIIEHGETNIGVVSILQKRLTERGYGPFATATYDANMVAVVKLYQSQNVDAIGRPLVIDGKIGIYTWGSLFPESLPKSQNPPSKLMLEALEVAITQDGVREHPLGENRGPMVDVYLRSVGINPEKGDANDRFWCMAFVYWCFQSAAESLNMSNPLPRTAGCVKHWKDAGAVRGADRIKRNAAYANAALIKPGQIFILDVGGGLGHTGIVERNHGGGIFSTIEGNTNTDKGTNGIGVFRSIRRKLTEKSLVGFVDYTNA